MTLKIFFAALLVLGSGWQQLTAQRPNDRQAQPKRVERRVLRVESGLDVNKRLVSPYLSVAVLLNKNTDGTAGYYLKQVNGPVLTAKNETFAFYPASTIKVIEHLHIMRGVQSGYILLKTPMDIWGDSCADNHAGEQPETKEPLSTTVTLMMKNSNNQRTNAIQDGFARPAINNTAHQIAGMSQNSALNHKFGCGGPTSNPANSLTLADIALLYEGVAKGTLLSGTSRDTFYQLMLNETDAFFIQQIINEEAGKLGLPAAKTNSFKSQVKIALKAGGIPADYDGFLYESIAGYVSLPYLQNCGNARTTHRGFVFGVFINKAKTITGGTTGTAASELFRDQVRAALATWKPCP